MRNKKGITEIVSYVILIVIGISIFTVVAVLLRLYVPKFQVPECPNDISIVIKDYTCTKSDQTLYLTLQNKGLFSVDALYVRLDKDEDKNVKTLISKPKDIHILYNGDPGLPPGKSALYSYSTPEIESAGTDTIYGLEIEPAVYQADNVTLALCESAVITQIITCA